MYYQELCENTCYGCKNLAEQIKSLRDENEALKLDVAVQLSTYKYLREAFMDGVYWYEQSNKVTQIALDKAAHEYANSVIEKQTTKEQSE